MGVGITCRDARWSTMRNTILSVYQPSHLASLIPTMQEFIDSATENLHSLNEEDITFSNLSLKLATDVIGQAAFGVNFGLSKPQLISDVVNIDDNQNDDNEVSDFINKHIYSTTQLKMDLSGSFSIILGLLVPILQEPFRQILKRIPGTMDWKVERNNQKLSGRLDEIVTKRMKTRERGSKDFLTLILNARESQTVSKNVFTPDYISAVTYEHLLAGSATTAFTLSSVVYLVAGHPEVEKKLLEEIDGFVPPDQMPGADDLQNKFPYLEQVRLLNFPFFVFDSHISLSQYILTAMRPMQQLSFTILLMVWVQVIKEAMRYYTVSPLVARETSKEVEIGGYLLPKVFYVCHGLYVCVYIRMWTRTCTCALCHVVHILMSRGHGFG